MFIEDLSFENIDPVEKAVSQYEDPLLNLDLVPLVARPIQVENKSQNNQ